MDVVWVFLGGGLGAALRWLASTAISGVSGTLVVNVVGCFLLGFLAAPGTGAPGRARLVLGTGVLGGFTTYSTFNLELVEMLARGQAARAAGYLAATVVGGLVAGALGFWLGGVAPEP